MDPLQAIIDRFFVDGDGNAAAAGPSWPPVDSSLYPNDSVTYGEVTADGARAREAVSKTLAVSSWRSRVLRPGLGPRATRARHGGDVSGY